MSITGIAMRYDSPFAAPMATTELSRRKDMRDTAPVRESSPDSEGYTTPNYYFSSAKAAMQANRELLEELQSGIELLKFTDTVITKIEDTLIDMQALAVRLGNAHTGDEERAQLAEKFSTLAGSLSSDSLRCLQWNGIPVAGAGLKGYYITINSEGDRVTLNDEVFDLEWSLGGALSTDRMITLERAIHTAARINADLTRLASFRSKISATVARLEKHLEAALEIEDDSWNMDIDCSMTASRITKASTTQIVGSGSLAVISQANVYGSSAMRHLKSA